MMKRLSEEEIIEATNQYIEDKVLESHSDLSLFISSLIRETHVDLAKRIENVVNDIQDFNFAQSYLKGYSQNSVQSLLDSFYKIWNSFCSKEEDWPLFFQGFIEQFRPNEKMDFFVGQHFNDDTTLDKMILFRDLLCSFQITDRNGYFVDYQLARSIHSVLRNIVLNTPQLKQREISCKTK